MSVSEEEVYAWLKSSVLEENRPMLCKTLTPNQHYPYLRSKFVLSRDEEELIEAEPTTKQKVHTFLEILMKKNGKGYDELVKSILQERTQIFVATKLNQAFEEKLKRLRAIAASKCKDTSSQQTGPTPIENLQKADLTKLGDLPKFESLQSQVSTVSGSVLRDSWKSACSDSVLESDNLPIPVMQKKVPDVEELRLSRKESCENSFEEDLDETKSVTDSIISESESKA